MSSKGVVGISVLLLAVFGLFLFMDNYKKGFNEATGLVVSEDSFPTYLETHPAIGSLPKSADVEIDIGENVYRIDGKDVSMSPPSEDKDVKIILPEGYENVIGELGLCEAIKKAYKEDKIKIETYTNKMVLFFKYRKLLKYGDCLK